MQKEYASPTEWVHENRNELKKFRGEWVAYSHYGVMVHDKDIHKVIIQADKLNIRYILRYIHPLDFIDPIKIRPIRLKALKKHEWQPLYPVILNQQKEMDLLVDSGADFCCISKKLGAEIGFVKREEDVVQYAEGVGGTVTYLLRLTQLTIDGFLLKVPAAWLQDEQYDDNLLGREVIFEEFDIEFKQAEEKIIFKKRN